MLGPVTDRRGQTAHTRAERARIAHLRTLREPPFREADRDRGLERAWTGLLDGATLRGGEGTLHLGRDGRFGFGAEHGRWRVTSNVGRAMLMLTPDGLPAYGYVLTRRAGGGIALNGAPYSSAPASAASAASRSIPPISRASSGVRRANEGRSPSCQ